MEYVIYLSPEGNCESGARWGPLDSLSILYVNSERKLTISILRVKSAFLKISKTFIVRMGGWVGGWGSKESFDFPHFVVYIQEKCADSKYGLKSCLPLLYNKL